MVLNDLSWKLCGVVIKNEGHFRGIVKGNDNSWFLYDGAGKGKKFLN